MARPTTTTTTITTTLAALLAPVLLSLLPLVLAAQHPAAPPPPPAPAPLPLRLQSFSIVVTDYDEAARWYADKLGFAVVRDQAFGRGGERFVLVAPPGQRDVGIVLQQARRDTAGGARADEPEMPADYSDRVGKTVNVVLWSRDVAAYADSLRRRGVALTSPVRQMPWGAQTTFRDLYGNTFVVVGPRARE